MVPSLSVSCDIFNMVSFHDSDPDESFEGFHDSDINDSDVTSTVEEDDDEDDRSVKSLLQMKKKVKKVRTNLHQMSKMIMLLHHVLGALSDGVLRKKLTWSERKTYVNFPLYSEMPGPTVTLDVDKVELGFFCLDVQFRFVCVNSRRDKLLCRTISRTITMAGRQTKHEMEANNKR